MSHLQFEVLQTGKALGEGAIGVPEREKWENVPGAVNSGASAASPLCFYLLPETICAQHWDLSMEENVFAAGRAWLPLQSCRCSWSQTDLGEGSG